MSRTLIFCTAYAQSQLLWQRRYRRWVDAILARGLDQTQIVLIDDGSTVLPGWSDTDIVTVRTPEDAAAIRSSAPVLLLHFPNRLGRAAVYDFPGWYRSYSAAARYAAGQGFTKVLHIESDAYIVSERLRAWLQETTTGWHTLWSEKFDFPEIAIQLIGADQIANFDAFTRQPYESLIGVTHETALPCTNIEKSFTGDRYGESEPPVPAAADFATQIPSQREASYYWWLSGAPGPAPVENRLTFGFAREQAGLPMLADGWSRPEPDGTWMLHAASIVNLPPLPQSPSFDFVMIGIPHVHRDRLLVQRLFVQINMNIVAQFDFPAALQVGCEIPGTVLRRDGTDKIRFLHPDAAQPSRYGVNDTRMLSVKLRDMSLQPRPAS